MTNGRRRASDKTLMISRSWLIPTLCCLAGACWAQGHINENPTISYTTTAVPVYKAIDDIARISEKHIRVEEPISHQLLVVHLHDALFNDVMEWLAATLHGTWVDNGNFKVLTRTNYSKLNLKNVAIRARASMIVHYIDNTHTDGPKGPLTPELANKYILNLNDPNIDHNRADYQEALLNSADTRLIDFALQTLNPYDLAGALYPNHCVFSSSPRLLQSPLKLSDAEISKIINEQNLWTKALQSQAAKHPELKAEAGKRLLLEPKSHVLLIFSDPVDGLPTHILAEVVGPGGYPRVRAERNISFVPHATTQQDLSSLNLSDIKLSSRSVDFMTAFKGGAITDDLKSALSSPSTVDPLQFVVGDGLLQIASNRGWNLIASMPDETLLDAASLTPDSNGKISGTAFVNALNVRCSVSFKDGLLLVSPSEPIEAETSRTDRLAFASYLASLARSGYSTTEAESSLASASGASFDPALVKLYARMLYPTCLPFLDAPMDALSLYGSFTSDQRKSLNHGISYGLTDLTPDQRMLLGSMLLNAPQTVILNKELQGIRTNHLDPEITDLVDTPNTPGELITLASRQEIVLRVVGTDAFGRNHDKVFTLPEAQTMIARLGPWQSLQYSSSSANTIKLTIHATNAADVICFLRDYPSAFPPAGDIASLPPDVQKAIAKQPASSHAKKVVQKG